MGSSSSKATHKLLFLGLLLCADMKTDFLLSVLQETNEKLAVKMCRLELTARNKDRWSREIQIMKKFDSFSYIFFYSHFCSHVCSELI